MAKACCPNALLTGRIEIISINILFCDFNCIKKLLQNGKNSGNVSSLSRENDTDAK